MIGNNLGLLILFGVAAFYAMLTGYVLLHPHARQSVTRWMVFFLVGSGVWVFIQWLPFPALIARVSVYGLLAISLLYYQLSLTFLQSEEMDRRWWWVSAGWMGVLLLTDIILALLRVPVAAWMPVSLWWLLLAAVGWAFMMRGTLAVTIRAYRQTDRRPLHRNRLRYWLAAYVFLAIADFCFFSGNFVLAYILRVMAATLVTYTITTYRLIDLRYVMRRTGSQFSAVLVAGMLYVAGRLLLLRYQDQFSAAHPLVQDTTLALIILLVYIPLQRLFQRLAERLGSEFDYDPNRTLREYSITISSIVDLGELEGTVVRLISEAMEISYGTLYLVDTGEDLVGRAVYELVSVQGFGSDKLVLGTFAANSPVAAHLARQHRPLTQYEIDVNPQFQALAEDEHEWLRGLGVEVFVPIYAKEQWIGLLGLGPKMSQNRYFERDLMLLSTLADQTAVALENARLVADLVRVNYELQQATAELETVNKQLRASDRRKSEFIGVITHELRTPFANIDFSMRLLEQHGLQAAMPERVEELNQLKVGITTARDMVDNLVKYATLINKQGDLRYTYFDFGEVVTETVRTLRPLIENKNLQLRVNDLNTNLSLEGDPDRLGDAVHHLLHNAIKFTGSGGGIRIRVWQENAQIRFEVRDSGVGIPLEKMPGLWDGFTQLADPLRRGVEGVGIGLSLVKYVVDAHQGKVYVRSKEQVGSVFGFAVPVSRP